MKTPRPDEENQQVHLIFRLKTPVVSLCAVNEETEKDDVVKAK